MIGLLFCGWKRSVLLCNFGFVRLGTTKKMLSVEHMDAILWVFGQLELETGRDWQSSWWPDLYDCHTMIAQLHYWILLLGAYGSRTPPNDLHVPLSIFPQAPS